MSFPIGIDLGTTCSSAAVFKKDEVNMVHDEFNKILVPSIVAFNDDQILVGDVAKTQLKTNPENSISQVKRLIGRKYHDNNIQVDRKSVPYTVVEHLDDQIKVRVRFNKVQSHFTPEEISAFILKRLKRNCESFLKTKLNKSEVVIGVPAYFNNNMKDATIHAGKIAGLNVKHIINEPTAAALAYGFGRDKKDKQTHQILVYDLGGGTFDISILKICGRDFRVVAITGDNHLGGEDFITRMVDHLFREFDYEYKIKNHNKFMLQRLRSACETAMKKLSTEKEAPIELEYFCTNAEAEDIHFYTSITREKFEQINADYFNKTLNLVSQCLRDAKMSEKDIDKVLLVGGSTRIPKIQKLVRDKFGDKKVDDSIDGNQVVAMGAAIEAAIRAGITKDTRVQHVTSATLGILVDENGRMEKFIPKNTPIPAEHTKILTNLLDNQTSALISVYEGESDLVAENVYLGKFSIYDIQEGPAGTIEFSTTFSVNTNGILTIKAADQKGQKEGRLIIRNKCFRTVKADDDQGGKPEFPKKVKFKRQLEKYTEDVEQFLAEESTKNSLNFKQGTICRTQIESARRFLRTSEDPTESDVEKRLSELKTVIGPILNKLFQNENGSQSIGELEQFD